MATLPGGAGILTNERHVAQTITTHYDNLKVRRDAPVGVIKTSYRKLSQQYHPDRNPDPGALEIMKLINLAWDVLRDPERRARHDRAIAAMERRSSRPAARPAARARARSGATPNKPAKAPPQRIGGWRDSDAVKVVGVLAFFLVVLFAVFHFATSGSDDGEDDDVATVIPSAPETTPLPLAQADRVPHGYLAAAVQDFTLGVASVEIDNTGGQQDAEVRLFRGGRAARSMFVHRGKRFAMEDLAPGTYVLKYKFVRDGKVHAYQERDVFVARRDKYGKLRVKLFDTPGSKRTADEIGAEQF